MPLYEVAPKNGNGPPRLVRSPTPHRARSHVSVDAYTVSIPNAERLVQLGSEGIKIEDASAPSEAETESAS